MKNNFRLFSLFSELAKDRLASTSRLLARLLGDEDGSYLIYGITMLPILIGVGGLATEGSLLFYNHRTLQSAADAAVYSAAISYSFDQNATNATTQANAVVASYGLSLGTGNNQANVCNQQLIGSTECPINNSWKGSGYTAITLAVSQPQSAIFSGYNTGFSALSNNVSATAIIAGLPGSPPAGRGDCILALGNTSTGNNAPNAIQLQGNATVTTPGCGIFSNSTDCSQGSFSESLGGNASVTAGAVGSAGCMNIFGNAQVNLPGGVTCNSGDDSACTQIDGAISDPLAGTQLPNSPAPPCTPQPSSSTLSPGRYCGLKITSNVTLSPGTYILDCSASTCPTDQGSNNSAMLIVKNATLTDTLDPTTQAGVTLVFDCSTCTSASQWPHDSQNNPQAMLVLSTGNNSVAVTLTAGANGFVMLGGTDMPLGTVFDTHSNPSTCLTGTVYVPNGAFQWGGTPSTGCSSTCLTMIVNTLSLWGNSTFGGSGCNSGGVASGSGGAGFPPGPKVTLVY